MGDRLATIDMGRKLGCVLLWEELDPMQYNVDWAEAYLRTKWHLDSSSRLATTDMGRKLGRLCTLRGWGWSWVRI